MKSMLTWFGCTQTGTKCSSFPARYVSYRQHPGMATSTRYTGQPTYDAAGSAWMPNTRTNSAPKNNTALE